jgi:hypothetical protein
MSLIVRLMELINPVMEPISIALSDKERQQSLDNCIDLLKGVPVRLKISWPPDDSINLCS